MGLDLDEQTRTLLIAGSVALLVALVMLWRMRARSPDTTGTDYDTQSSALRFVTPSQSTTVTPSQPATSARPAPVAPAPSYTAIAAAEAARRAPVPQQKAAQPRPLVYDAPQAGLPAGASYTAIAVATAAAAAKR